MNLPGPDPLFSSTKLPDVSVESSVEHAQSLHKVGMEGIEIPVKIGRFQMPAKVDAFVSLDQPEAKGIHMSRLYLETKSAFEKQELSLESLKCLLDGFLTSHHNLSKSAHINVVYDLPVERKALLSGELGWRTYPVELKAAYVDGKFEFEAKIEVLYSSTCPCSAALARQLLAEKFQEDHKSQSLSVEQVANWLRSEENTAGTAHAQRSVAQVSVRMGDVAAWDPLSLIDQVESTLGTPVQAAVKRADEQEFARLNAQNLMFCEDACRKIKVQLEEMPNIQDYKVKVIHQESLHPHDAVAVSVKGLDGGFKP